MTAARYHAEVDALSMSLPKEMFKFFDIDTDKPYVKIAAVSNSKKVYTLKIELDQFPESIPKVFITKMLKSKTGQDLSGVSGAMHTLQSENGYTRICHYGNSSWAPNVALNKIYLKCRVWIEAYEAHLETGETIETFLGHQS